MRDNASDAQREPAEPSPDDPSPRFSIRPLTERPGTAKADGFRDELHRYAVDQRRSLDHAGQPWPSIPPTASMTAPSPALHPWLRSGAVIPMVIAMPARQEDLRVPQHFGISEVRASRSTPPSPTTEL